MLRVGELEHPTIRPLTTTQRLVRIKIQQAFQDFSAPLRLRIVGYSRFPRMPSLNQFQAINSPSQPLRLLKNEEQDQLWVKLVNSVEDTLKTSQEEIFNKEQTTVELQSKERHKIPDSRVSTQASPQSFLNQSASETDLMKLKFEAADAELEGERSKAMELWQKVLSLKPDDPKALYRVQKLVQGKEALVSFSEDLGGGTKLTMMEIPEGSFWMGSPKREEKRDPDEGPQHRVVVSPFWLGKYPVTQAQWMEVAAYPKVDIHLSPDPSWIGGADRPVERISWHEAVEFCARLTHRTGKEYRLPSEAEWEYACRARTVTPFSFGETISTDVANYDGSFVYGGGVEGWRREMTTPVDQFTPNAFGLYDMHGNVWEWCADWWHENYDDAPSDGTPWIQGGQDQRVLRGGSWFAYPWACRSAYRGRRSPDYLHSSYGFRVAYSSARRVK